VAKIIPPRVWHTIYYVIFSFLNCILSSPISRVRIHTHSAVKNRAITRRAGAIIYIVRHARPGVFYNLPCDAISIGDRSNAPRRVHAPRIAIAHTRMYGMRTCRHTRAHTHTCVYAREEPQG